MGKKDDWSFKPMIKVIKMLGRAPILGGRQQKQEAAFLRRRRKLRGLKKGGTVTKG